ncbi:MAG: periplasmic heavy metal sensor [Hyphomicrobium sp.]|nr:periplasmic heavy metal sensor [Hyphomicrobium sp.]
MTDTPPASAELAPASGRRWLLVGSLALNLLFLGGLGALWWKGPMPGFGHPGPAQTAFGLMKFSRDLPPERRDAVRRHLKEARLELRGFRDELLAARRNAAEVLKSADYTPEKMRAALDAIASADQRIRDRGTAALVNAIGELTPEERATLAGSWQRRLEKPAGRKEKQETGELDDGPPR